MFELCTLKYAIDGFDESTIRKNIKNGNINIHLKQNHILYDLIFKKY
jgi:reverse gyrase